MKRCIVGKDFEKLVEEVVGVGSRVAPCDELEQILHQESHHVISVFVAIADGHRLFAP